MTKETMAWAISCENNPKGSKGQKGSFSRA